ncbi:BtrH N-terminal domain-containing protein [Dinghuibacter silviterrae]|uniref:Butirosin biosynthesis protein H-like n=1 Tax=Dinghuibacter silviterrae TaxID=1539049 RepID=A0A4R8DSV1_9BACT|nr:BtrH N-terminal domain-containing protein [Dinghuibacter silviterrae]TDX01352.1 butirosin biosynthesis protein H-like [Dinghuibacter silviterrae]
MKTEFHHLQSAHCETGVTTGLMHHIGIDKITEPLALGIGAGLFYIYIPFIKISNGPAIAFRVMPGLIFKRVCKALGIPVVRRKFGSREEAARALDQQLAAGQPVGCQVGVYYLTYFPKEYRFHFNAHNIVVFGREEDRYLVSDPVMETTTSLSAYELERVRFAKGALAPKGQLYYPVGGHQVTDEQIARAIRKGIKNNAFAMLHIPGPIAGISGIRYTARRIRKWRDKLGLHDAGLYLAQLVRMQEEIGTGGGGFRYMYAAFLQEAMAYTPHPSLPSISAMFTRAGDLWRTAAVQAAGIYKGRLGSQEDFDKMADYLMEIADIEEEAFRALANIKWAAP